MTQSMIVPMKGIDKNDTIAISIERIACPRHGEPFRANWPKGWAMFSLPLVQEILESEEVHEEIAKLEGHEGDPDHKLNPRTVEQVLDIRPACCRVSPERLLKAYHESNVGTIKRCKVCGKKRSGTSYKTSLAELSHVCFECVIHQMAPLN